MAQTDRNYFRVTDESKLMEPWINKNVLFMGECPLYGRKLPESHKAWGFIRALSRTESRSYSKKFNSDNSESSQNPLSIYTQCCRNGAWPEWRQLCKDFKLLILQKKPGKLQCYWFLQYYLQTAWLEHGLTLHIRVSKICHNTVASPPSCEVY